MKNINKTRAYLLVLITLVTIGSSYADSTTVINYLNSLRTNDSALPNVPNQKGQFGYILSEIFNIGGKIKPEYLDYSGISAWTQSGSQTYLTTTTGSVGIGTANPVKPLEVYGDIASTNSSNTAQMGQLRYYGLVGYGGDIQISALSANTNLVFKSSGIERMRIDTSGNVGIGTTVSGEKLDINGNIRVGNRINSIGDMHFGIDEDNDAADIKYFSFWKNGISTGSELMRIQENGRVGIGTASPLSPLDVAGDGTNAIRVTEGNAIRWTDVSGNNSSRIYASSDDSLRFDLGSSNSRVMTLINGNVGIGTTSPSMKLDVNGDMIIRGNLTVTGSINNVLTSLISATNVSSGQFGANTGGGNYSFMGNIGIGTTSPTYPLDVAGSINTSGTIGIGSVAPIPTRGINLGIDFSNSSGQGIYNTITTSGTHTANRTTYGAYNNINNTADNSTYTNTIYATLNTLNNNSTSTTGTNNLYGDFSQVINVNNGSVGTTRGVYGFVKNAGTGSITTAQGVHGFVQNAVAGGTITNGYGGYFNVTQSAGTITNGYGVYIAATQASTLDYGLYQAGPGNDNYFAGDVGIGTANPGGYRTAIRGSTDDSTASALWVSGANSLTGALVVRNDGNVGIGTASPSYKLTVSQPVASYGIVTTDGTTETAVGIATDNAGMIGTRSNHALYIRTNNTNKMTIDTTGNIGIGTTTPATKLDASDTVDGTSIRISSKQDDSLHTVNGAYGSFEVYSSDASSAGAGVKGAIRVVNERINGDFSAMTFSTSNVTANDNERMRITSNGNIGIGTTAPQTSFHFERSGTTDFLMKDTSQALDQKSWLIRNSVASFKIGRVDDAFTTLLPSFVIANGGNVGIGTAGPGGRLVVIGAGATSGTYGLNVTKSDGTSNFFVRDDGNVGIGTASPGAMLDVYSTSAHRLRVSNASYGIELSQPAGASSPHINAFGAGTNLFFDIGDSSKMTILNNGSVGIGTANPVKPLEVYGDIASTNSSNTAQMGQLRYYGLVGYGGDIQISALSANTNLVFKSSGIERMRIDTSGNVGIGTTSPATKLHVNGDIAATGWVGAGCEGNCEASGGYAVMYPDGHASATIGWQTASDSRIKKDIRPLENSIEKLKKITGIRYKLKKGSDNLDKIGVIAQDVEKVFPEMVSTDKNGMKAVNYDKLVAPLIEAVKEQQKQIEKFQKKNAELQKRIEKLEKK